MSAPEVTAPAAAKPEPDKPQFDPNKYNLVAKATDPIVNAIAEPGMQLVSGAYHAAKGGLTGIYDIATGQGTDEATADIESEEAKTYRPTTPVGKAVSKAVGYIPARQAELAKLAGGGVAAGFTKLGASPEVAGAAGATVDTGLNMVGPGTLLKGARALKGAGRERVPAKPNFDDVEIPGYGRVSQGDKTVQADMVQKARAAGYVLKPSEAGGKAGKVAEGLTGSPRLSIEASLKNQPVTNNLAATEIGLPKGTKVTNSALREAAKPHNAVYKEVGALGGIDTDDVYHKAIESVGRTPGTSFKKVSSPDIDKLRDQYAEAHFEAADAVLEVRRLRAASGKNLKAPLAPAQNELGHAQRQVADAIEDQIERHATEAGQTDLVARLRESRAALAKIHSVRAALLGNTGDISAVKLAKMQQKGAPLSGNLKLIADVADEFGEVTRDATKLKNKVPVTVLEGGAGLAGAAMTAAHSPGVGIPLLGGMIARPVARKFLLSDTYQDTLGQGPKKANTIADIESR